MDKLLELWRAIVGDAPNYFTYGNYSNPQWHYGNILEYCFVSLAAIIVIILVFRLIFMLASSVFGKKR